MRTTRSLLGGAMVLGLGVAVLPGVAGAAPPDYQQQDRITAPDGGGTMDYFGSAVALDDDTMVVGAPGNDAALVDSGAVYILERSTGTWSGFYYSEAEADLGASVAFDGDTMVVGAPRADGVGSALVVTRSEGRWQVQDKLTAPDGATNDDFGAAVAVSVDTAVVGAPGKGAAYVFTRLGDGWVLEDQVTTSLAADSQFGASVAVDGDIAVVGAPSLNRSGGTAYFFERSGSTWTETTTFGGGGELGDLVGASVARWRHGHGRCARGRRRRCCLCPRELGKRVGRTRPLHRSRR